MDLQHYDRETIIKMLLGSKFKRGIYSLVTKDTAIRIRFLCRIDNVNEYAQRLLSRYCSYYNLNYTLEDCVINLQETLPNNWYRNYPKFMQ